MNVRDHDTMSFELATDQQSPVAVEWILFRTHHRQAVTPQSLDQTIDPGAKDCCLGEAIVLDSPMLIQGRVTLGRAPSSLPRKT